MGKFSVLNEQQRKLCQECGINPEGLAVILENDTVLWMLHLKTRNEISIQKNRSMRNGRT